MNNTASNQWSKNIKVILLIIIFLAGLAFLLNQVLSKPAPNKILIYTNIDNLSSKKETDLVLFLAGFTIGSPGLLANYDFGGLALSPYLEDKYRKNIIFASIDTIPVTHWGSPDAVKSILKNIKQLMKLYNIKRIFIIGGSMGSSLTLNLASQADEEIKSKITGVIAYLPITDYDYTLQNTKNQSVKDAILKHFSENKDESLIKKSSPITYINDLPEKIKIILIATASDQTVPPEQVYTYFNKAKELGKNIELYKVPGDHNTGYIQNVYRELVLNLLK